MSFNADAPRCARCRLHEARCLCEDVERLATEASVLLLPQIRDWRRPSNTGRLAEIALGAEVFVLGRPGEPLRQDLVLRDGHRHVLLHPGDDAQPLAPSDGRPVRVIVPDGSWRQSARIARRVLAMPGVERVAIRPRPGPTLRRRPSPDRACTAEAIAAALDALGEPAAADTLRAALRVMVRRTVESRG